VVAKNKENIIQTKKKTSSKERRENQLEFVLISPKKGRNKAHYTNSLRRNLLGNTKKNALLQESAIWGNHDGWKCGNSEHVKKKKNLNCSKKIGVGECCGGGGCAHTRGRGIKSPHHSSLQRGKRGAKEQETRKKKGDEHPFGIQKGDSTLLKKKGGKGGRRKGLIRCVRKEVVKDFRFGGCGT